MFLLSYVIDGRPIIPKMTGVTGSHAQSLFLFHLSVFSFCSQLFQARIFEGASTVKLAHITYYSAYAAPRIRGFSSLWEGGEGRATNRGYSAREYPHASACQERVTAAAPAQ